jgi:methylmalonyl-CoA/ethylmalonyl-CoA epimerase
MLDKIDHIGIAVENLEEAIENYRALFGIEPDFREEVSGQKVTTAGFKVGEAVVEFLEPTAVDSPIAEFVNNNGSALHHIAYRVENLERTLSELKRKNILLIDETPRIGAGGKKIAFIHPKSTNGILIELCE